MCKSSNWGKPEIRETVIKRNPIREARIRRRIMAHSFCTECGSKFEDNQSYCSACGFQLI